MIAATVGARLGRYRLQRSLGRGGEGEVFLAIDTDSRRPVAVKVIHSRLSQDAGVRAQREAAVLAKLQHPNIVDVFAVGHQNHVWYVAMEWVEGTSMAQRIARDGPLPEPEALRLVADAAAALAAAHRTGVLHCDVNPKNMLYDEASSSLRIVDFGLSVLPQQDRRPTRLAGTLQYIAPELWEGRDLSTKVDVYALGLSLYYLLTGRPAIEGHDTAQCRAAHAAGIEAPARWSTPTATLFRDASAIEPDHRITMQELLTRTLRLLSEIRSRTPVPRLQREDVRQVTAALCGVALPSNVLVTADAMLMLMEAVDVDPAEARVLITAADQIRARLGHRCLSTMHVVRVKSPLVQAAELPKRWPNSATLMEVARLRKRYGSVPPCWLSPDPDAET